MAIPYNTKLTPSNIRLKIYTGEKLTFLGKMRTQVRYRPGIRANMRSGLNLYQFFKKNNLVGDIK